MAETTLKDESVIEIGQTVTKGFNDLVNSGKSVLINPAGQPLTSGGDTGLEVEPERSPVMGVLEDIRDSMQSLVETFAESLSFQKQEEKEAERAERVSSDDIAPPSDDGGDTGGGFLAGVTRASFHQLHELLQHLILLIQPLHNSRQSAGSLLQPEHHLLILVL